MPTNHEAVAALPNASAADKTLLRNLVTKRLAYVLADADDPTNLVAVDPDTGAAIIDIIYLGRVFHYDATDTTTPHDGTTCIVTSDGRRYKLASGTEVVAYSVLDRDLAAPPISPSIGDAYLVAAGATGAWAGHSYEVAVYTIRSWEFLNFGIGRLIYVEDIDSYFHKDSGGNWLAGFGAQTLSSNSVPLSAAINFGKQLIVENQTTTAPPVSPTVGTAYIIGPSATGAWAGHDAKIAICEVAGSFTIYTPGNGWEAYDKARGNSFHFDGSAWISSAGAFVGYKSVESSTPVVNRSISTFYTYSNSVAPTKISGNYDTLTLTYAAKRAGGVGDRNLVFEYQARYNISNTTAAGIKDITIALFRDAETTALDWISVAEYVQTGSVTESKFVNCRFEIPANDTAEHTYSIAILDVNAATSAQDIGRRRFTVRELS